METKFKQGDTAKLVTLERSAYEGVDNWIKSERSRPKIGDTYTVISEMVEDTGNWLDLQGLQYSHPSDKFELA